MNERRHRSMMTFTAGLLQAQAYRALSNFLVSQLQPYDLTVAEWSLLGQLWERPAMRLVQLSDILSVKAPLTTRMVRGLEERGLIVRRSDNEDSRAQLVAISEAGRELLERIEVDVRQQMREFLHDVEPEDLEVYLKVMEQISRKL